MLSGYPYSSMTTHHTAANCKTHRNSRPIRPVNSARRAVIRRADVAEGKHTSRCPLGNISTISIRKAIVSQLIDATFNR